jgi:hypothetical protein
MTPRRCWRRAGGLCCSLGATRWRLRISAPGGVSEESADSQRGQFEAKRAYSSQ